MRGSFLRPLPFRGDSFRSFGEAALQAGNSEAIIRKHYLDLKSKTEAEEFFGIMPKGSFAGADRPVSKPKIGVAA